MTLVTAERPAASGWSTSSSCGLDAPICLTWELTYACNLACVHCLSSSGRRDPDELSTDECKALIDEFERMQIFYVNIGGGEPTIRSRLLGAGRLRHRPPRRGEVLDQRLADHPGGGRAPGRQRLRRRADLPRRRHRRGQRRRPGGRLLSPPPSGPWSGWRRPGSSDSSCRWWSPGRTSASSTPSRRWPTATGPSSGSPGSDPSGRGADVWDELHPTADQQRQLYDWLLAHGEQVLTGDSFFHLAGYGEALPGLNLCGAGRVVCLVDPVGDVYACPFAIHDEFRAGNVRSPGGFDRVWRPRTLFADLRQPDTGGACGSCGHYDACRGGCMAAKFFTGLPLDGPDPECVLGHGERAAGRRSTAPARPDRRPTTPADPAPGAGGGGPPPPPARPGLRRAPAGRPSTPATIPTDRCPAWSTPSSVAGRTAPSRVVFGPHETNLGDGRGSATATSPTTGDGRPAGPASS